MPGILTEQSGNGAPSCTHAWPFASALRKLVHLCDTSRVALLHESSLKVYMAAGGSGCSAFT